MEVRVGFGLGLGLGVGHLARVGRERRHRAAAGALVTGALVDGRLRARGGWRGRAARGRRVGRPELGLAWLGLGVGVGLALGLGSELGL